MQALITMAATIFVPLIIALLFVGQSFQAPAEGLDMDAKVKEVQATFAKAIDGIKKSLKIPDNPDGQAVIKAIHEQQKEAEKRFGEVKNSIEEAIKKNPEFTSALNNLKAKIEEGQAMLKKENPEVAANAQKVADELKTAYENVGKELQKVNDEVNKKGGIREDLDNLLKNLINRGTTAAKEFQSKIDAAIKKEQKS